MDISQKVVVISGAGSGIGKALALECAKKGAKLAISDISAEHLSKIREEVESIGATVHSSILDVANWEDYQHYASQVAGHFTRVDVVINNAGVALGPFSVEETRLDEFEWLMNINFWGMVYGTKAFLPYLRKSKEATLANVSSILGMGALAKNSAYCSSKFAIRGFTETLRMEAAIEFPHVNILSIHPGGIQTNIVKNARWNDDRISEQEKADTNAEFEKSFINTPAYAAKAIIKAIEKKKKRLLIGSDARRLARIIQWFPVLYTKIMMNGLVNKTIGELVKAERAKASMEESEQPSTTY